MRAVCDFRVVGESADWIVVEKPAPLAVHPANGKIEPTLLSGLETLLAYELANGAALSILTRLDRETSGLVLVAKHRAAAAELSRELAERRVEKEYIALVHGWPEWEEKRLDAPILRAGEIEPSAIWLRQRVHPDGRECVTAFRVEARFENGLGRFSRIRCFPETGRMHQIRVHLAHLGHPIVGDKVYAFGGRAYLEQVGGRLGDEAVAAMILPRQALHACRLRARWRGGWCEWRSELPPDLARFAASSAVSDGHGEAGRGG